MAQARNFVLALAIANVIAAIAAQPQDMLMKSRSLLESGKVTQSEELVRNFINTHPDSADAHFLLGYVLFREKKAAESLAEFTAGAKIRRPKADELKTVASDYVLLADYSDADKWFTQVTVETPGDPDAWYLLGRTQYNESEFTAAAASFEHALALHPKYVEAENNLGLAQREASSMEKAKAAFQNAIDWQGSSPSDAQPFLNLGTLLADEGEFDKSISLLVEAASLSPDNPKIHEELGRVFQTQKNLPKAQAELEKAVALAPDISGLHYELGQIYRHEGLNDQAQRQFDACEKLNSTHSSAKTPNPITPDVTAPR